MPAPWQRGSDSGIGRRRTEGYMLRPSTSAAGPSEQQQAGGMSEGGRLLHRRPSAHYTEGQDIMDIPTRIPVAEEEEQAGSSAEDLTLGFAAGRAAAAGLRQALQQARERASSSGRMAGAAPASMAGGSIAERERLIASRKSLDWMPRADKSDASKAKNPKGSKGSQAGGPAQPPKRQRDKFVPLPFVTSEVGPLDKLVETVSEGPEADPLGTYHSLPEQEGEPYLTTLSHAHELATHQSVHHDMDRRAAGTVPLELPSVSTTAVQPAAMETYRGRITVYCIAEALDRKALNALLQRQYKAHDINTYVDVVHLCLGASPEPGTAQGGRPKSMAQATTPTSVMTTSPSFLRPASSNIFSQLNGTVLQRRASSTGGPGAGAGDSAGGSGTSAAALGGKTGAGVSNVGRSTGEPVADVFFFDYGVIICWGMSEQDEKDLVSKIGKMCEVASYMPDEVEVDEFQFHFSPNERPHIKNDTFCINRRQASDHQVRLAISHALAQSAKLSVYEEKVLELADETKDLPESLAECGNVSVSSTKVAKLIGKVFLQSSTVNLLSTVLDTPEYFWSAPDSLQALYERAREYLELETRVEVLNTRFQVLQEMLDMLRNHQNNYHATRLEWIIVWLLLIDVVLMLFQLLGLLGFLKEKGPLGPRHP